MKKRIKAIALAVVALLSLSTAALPKNANAGVVLMVLGLPDYYRPQVAVGLAFVLAGAIIGGPAGVVLVVLDSDGKIPEQTVANALVSRFPELADQNAATRDLAAAIRDQVDRVDVDAVEINGKIELSLPENQVRELIARPHTNLSDAQIDRIARALH